MNADTGLVVPPGTRLVHIGPHKTGSTAIQVALHQARPELAGYGVHYGGPDRRPRLAGWSLGLPGRKAETEPPDIRHWHELVADVERAGDLRVCVSNEDFGRADADLRQRIVDDLGGDRVHVVAVARRLDSYFASQWQERVKAGVTLGWEDWLRIVLDRESDEFEWERLNVWCAHDVETLVSAWTEVVGPDRFTLIVGDPDDRDQLPRTFEQLLGLPEGLLRPDPSKSNRSLSWGETELVRSLHGSFEARDVSRRGRDRWVGPVLHALRRGDLPRIGPSAPPLPPWASAQVRELGVQRAEAIRRMHVRLVGSGDSMLMPPGAPVGPVDEPPPVSPETAAAVLDALVETGLSRSTGTGPGAAAPDGASAPGPETDRPARRAARRVVRRIRG